MNRRQSLPRPRAMEHIAKFFRVLAFRIQRLFRPPPSPPRLHVSHGHLSEEQLFEAERLRRVTGSKDIGQNLIELGYVGERELAQAEAQEKGYGFVDLDKLQIREDVLSSVPLECMRDHCVIPVYKEGANIWLAMANINNIQAQDAVRAATGCRVIPVVALRESIDRALSRLNH